MIYLYINSRSICKKYCFLLHHLKYFHRKNVNINLQETYSHVIPENISKYFDRYKFMYDDRKNSNIFSIVLPPPNITGTLHLGHALTITLQDVLCRWMRMNGSNVCWLPGIDHAGIATQVVVEKYLSKLGKTRLNLGYDEFQNELWKWKSKNETRIQQQIEMLGASVDFSRKVFTLDEQQNKAVNEAFTCLFNEGLIYRANRLINWCCYLQSTISDIEIQNLELCGSTYLNIPNYSKPIEFGLLTKFAYKIQNSSEEIVVATTRPETMLGDVAVAVHPTDQRYSCLIGCKLQHPFLNKLIPIIAEDSVDINFGTGAVKVTPAHDKNDCCIAKKHNLEIVSVINEGGLIENGFSCFSGMKRYEARAVLLDKLKELNLLRNIKEHNMSIPICSRSGDVIEQIIRNQWYIDCKKMAADAIKCVNEDKFTIVPKNYIKIWNDWLEKEEDWCISRQLWWGHRIPAYKCYKTSEKDNYIWIAATDYKEAKLKATQSFNSNDIICEQDKDVLDTWFSSGIYPFSAHGWPDETKDYKNLYPLNLMITGHDILCFWVIRMIMLGSTLTNKIPFPKVLLHSVVCDLNGVKMSKSKGNVIDPQDIIEGISLEKLNEKANTMYKSGLLSKNELVNTINVQQKQYPKGISKCGTDALRFTLCSYNIKNTYMNFNIDECFSNTRFCNKIWQSLKYSLMITEKVSESALNDCKIDDLNNIDRWLLSRLSSLVMTVNESINEFDFHLVTNALRQFLYNDMCDTFIEFTKQNVKNDFNEKKISCHIHTFSVCFNTALRLLHPIMPYLTEKLISNLPLISNCIFNYNDNILNLTAPQKIDFYKWKNEELEIKIKLILSIISAIRHIKTSNQISKKIETTIYIEGSNSDIEIIMENKDKILFLSSCKDLQQCDNLKNSNIWTYTFDNKIKVHLDFEHKPNNINLININIETTLKKKNKIENTLLKMHKTMAAEGYNKVPENIRVSHKQKIIALKEELEKLDQKLAVKY